MGGKFFEVLELLLEVLSFGGSSSSSTPDDEDKPRKNKKIKYLTEKTSAAFIASASILLFWVFKDPLPPENYGQTFMVAAFIGTAFSGIVFFILYVLDLYYFKSLFKLLLFSGSVILFFISVTLCMYYKSGIWI